MVVYILAMLVIVAVGIFERYRGGGLPSLPAEKSVSAAVKLLVLLMLWLIAGLRYNVGTDYVTYADYYKAQSAFPWLNFEAGYRLLNRVLFYITADSRILFLTTSFVTLYLISLVLDKYSKDFYLSLFLFVTLYFYFNSFNVIRQYMAVAIVFWGTKYLVRKNFIKYALTVAVAGLFHVTALFMLPLYFFVSRDYRFVTYLALTASAVLIVAFRGSLIAWGVALIPKYAGYINYTLGESSSNISIVLSGAVFFFMALFSDKLKSEDAASAAVYRNMAFVAFVFNILSLFNILFYRVGSYAYIYSLLSIPACIELFEKWDKTFIRAAVYVVLFLLCCYQLLSNNGGVLPYRLG